MAPVLRELLVLVEEPRFTVSWWARELRHRWYLRGRWSINGRQSRYSAGNDIVLATFQILREFEQDMKSPYFHDDHEEVIPLVRDLIVRGEALDRDNENMEVWSAWLRDVAAVVPDLWD